jgi:glutathione S-transferase
MYTVGLVVILALIEYLVFGLLVGRARVTYKIPAPAITGDPMFERYFRVHQNTMEQLLVFIPAVILFAVYLSVRVAAALGILFVLARAFYAYGYIGDPERRAGGAMATFVVNVVLLIGGLIGALWRIL